VEALNGTAGKFRFKSKPMPLAEERQCWTLGAVADATGAALRLLAEPPPPALPPGLRPPADPTNPALAAPSSSSSLSLAAAPLSSLARPSASAASEPPLRTIRRTLSENHGSGSGSFGSTPTSQKATAMEEKEEKEEEAEAAELSYDEQQLLNCVALALSTAEGPPPTLLREVEARMGEALLATRLLKVMAPLKYTRFWRELS
jgi:hypothetical protein